MNRSRIIFASVFFAQACLTSMAFGDEAQNADQQQVKSGIFSKLFRAKTPGVAAPMPRHKPPAPASSSSSVGLRKGAVPVPQTAAPLGQPITTLSRSWPSLVMAAGPYARYRQIVHNAAITQPGSPQDLERVMMDLASFDGPRLSRAFHAHAVLWAMQSPTFAQGILRWGRMYDRKSIIANLHANPLYVEQMPDYEVARDHVLRVIKEDGEATFKAGQIYKNLAYSLQKQKWAMKVRGSKSIRMAALRNAPHAPRGVSVSLLDRLNNTYTLRPPTTPIAKLHSLQMASLPASAAGHPIKTDARTLAKAVAPVLAPVVAPARAGELQDIMAMAAIYILDPGASFPRPLPSRNAPDYMAECVDWARLHLNQCVAATRYSYEDSFCIARHQLKDSGRCIAEFLDGAPVAATH